MVSMRPRRGFTLIELLVVLAAIGLLLSVVAPSYVRHVDHAREVALKEDLATVRDGLDKFHADHARYPADLAEMVQTRYLREVPEDPVTQRTDTWVFVTAPEGGVRDLRSGSAEKSTSGEPYANW